MELKDKWHHIGYDSKRINQFLTDPDITELFQDEAFVSSLTSLKFKKCHLLTNASFKTIFTSAFLKNVTEISVNNCCSFDFESLLFIAEAIRRSNVDTISVVNSLNITDLGIETLIHSDGFKKVKKLSFSKCRQIYDSIFAKLISSQQINNLTHLKLSYSHITNKGIDLLAKQELSKNLQYLNVSGCHFLDDDALGSIAQSDHLISLESLIMNDLDYITSIGVRPLLESPRGLKMKKLSFVNCNRLDESLFTFLTESRKVQGLEYFAIQSRNITDWRPLVKYLQCDNVKHLKILKIFQAFNQNAYVADEIDKALATSPHLESIEKISLLETMTLRKFLKSPNCKNMKCIDFIPINTSNSATTEAEIKSMLKYHKNKIFSDDEGKLVPTMLISNKSNISVKAQHPFFSSIKVLSLRKISHPKLIKNLLLKNDFSNLEVLQVIHCSNLAPLIELLQSWELKNLRTLHISQNPSETDDIPELFNKVFRAKLPKLTTLNLIDNSVSGHSFKKIENVFISPLLDTLKTLSLKKTHINEESARKISGYFNIKCLKRLKIHTVDIIFIRNCLKTCKQPLQVHMRNLILPMVLLSKNSSATAPLTVVEMEGSINRISVPDNIEIIVDIDRGEKSKDNESNTNVTALLEKDNNVKFRFRDFAFSELLLFKDDCIEEISDLFVPYIDLFSLDTPDVSESPRHRNRALPFLSKLKRIETLNIGSYYKVSENVMTVLTQCKIKRIEITSEANAKIYQLIAEEFKYVEQLGLSFNYQHRSAKEAFVELLDSHVATNFTELKITTCEWLDDDLLAKISSRSQNLSRLKVLRLTQNTQLTTSAIMKFFKNSKFAKINSFKIGDLKRDFKFTKDNIQTIESSCFAKVSVFGFNGYTEISTDSVLEVIQNGVIPVLLKISNQAMRKKLLKIFIARLLESHKIEIITSQFLKESMTILRKDQKLRNKFKLTADIVQSLYGDNDNYPDYDPILFANWSYASHSENNKILDDNIVNLFLNKLSVKYLIKFWKGYDKMSTGSFCKLIECTKKTKRLKKLIEKMNYRFFITDVLKVILENPYGNQLNTEWLYQKFSSCSKESLIQVFKMPDSQFSVDFYLKFCEDLKGTVKNLGELAAFNVPVIKSMLSLTDVFVERILRFFGDIPVSKLKEIFPKIFNSEAYELVLYFGYSFSTIVIFKDKRYFQNLHSLTFKFQPSEVLHMIDPEVLEKISDLTLESIVLLGEVEWLAPMKNLKKLRLSSTRHDWSFVDYVVKQKLKISELELSDIKSDGTEELSNFWIDALKSFTELKKLTLIKLKVSEDKLEDLLESNSISQIEYLSIKYLPNFKVDHMKIMGTKQPRLKFFEFGLHHITNQYIEVIAKSPHFEKLEVLRISNEDKTINFKTGLNYLLESKSLITFKFDEFLKENSGLITDEIMQIVLEQKLVEKFTMLDLTKAEISTATFLEVFNRLQQEQVDIINVIERHSFCKYFNNEVYEVLTKKKYNDAIMNINLNQVKSKLKMTLLQKFVSKSITQFYMRTVFAEYAEEIDDDVLDFFVKMKSPLQESGVIIQLNDTIHKTVHNLMLNRLICNFPHPEKPLAYEWAITSSRWRNMLEAESLKVFVESLGNYQLSLPKDSLDLEENIFLTSNGNASILQEIDLKNQGIFTGYLQRKFQKWSDEVFGDRYKLRIIAKDEICGDLILQILRQTPYLKSINLKNKNFGDELTTKIAFLMMERNKKNAQFVEEIILNDNPRITNVGLKNLYSALIMDTTLLNVNVYLRTGVKKSNLDYAFSNGLHNTLKTKYREYWEHYKAEGIKRYDSLCIPICFYSIFCLPFALMQCFEDKCIAFIKGNKKLKVYYKKAVSFKKKLFKEKSIKQEIVLDKDEARREKFIFTENCVKLNNKLGNKWIWAMLLFDALLYYFVCLFSPINFIQGCTEGVFWGAYVMYGCYAALATIFEFYLLRIVKKEIDDPDIFDISIGSGIMLISSATAKFTLFTDTLFMVTSFSCNLTSIGAASLTFLILHVLAGLWQVYRIMKSYIIQRQNPYYDTFLSLLARFAYNAEFTAIAQTFEKFASSSAIKIGDFYLPQIMFTTLIKFSLESVPQGVLQVIKLATTNNKLGGQGVNILAFISTFVNLLLMFNSVMRTKPSVCTSEMINELSRSTRTVGGKTQKNREKSKRSSKAGRSYSKGKSGASEVSPIIGKPNSDESEKAKLVDDLSSPRTVTFRGKAWLMKDRPEFHTVPNKNIESFDDKFDFV